MSLRNPVRVPTPSRASDLRSKIWPIGMVLVLLASAVPLMPSGAEAASSRTVTITTEPAVAGHADHPLTIGIDGFDDDNDLIASVRVDGGSVSIAEALNDAALNVDLAEGYDDGEAEVTFSGPHNDMRATLEDHVRWEVPGEATTTDVAVSVTEAPTGEDFFYFPGHPDGIRFYEYVADEGIHWTDAHAATQELDLLDEFDGVAAGAGSIPGYLATITSGAENEFVAENTTAENIWIGASDHHDRINDALGETRYDSQCDVDPSEGRWYWVTGPEAGTHFWTGNEGDATAGCPDSWDGDSTPRAEVDPETGEPHFTSWAANEPNDHGDDGEHFAATKWNSDLSYWNDLSDGTDRAEGYLVEYGGLGDTGLIPQTSATVSAQTVNAIIVSADPALLEEQPGTPVDVEITLTDDVIGGLAGDDLLLVTLELPENGGTLHVDQDGRDLELEEGYAFDGPEIGFTGKLDDVVDALTDAVTWQAPTQAGDVEVRAAVTQIPDTDNEVFYNPHNGHYYEHVTEEGISFLDALDAAEDHETLFGLEPWLATPVDGQQNRFIAEFTTAENVWIGASDSAELCNRTSVGLCSQFFLEGRWHWISGPQEGEEFWRGAADGSPVDDRFSAWAPGEPNDHGAGEDFAVTNWRGTVGQWNDLRNDPGSRISGYLVEYGYIDDQTENTAAQGRDIGTLTVLPELPGPPQNLEVSTAHVDDDHRISASWSAAGDGGGEVTGYEASIAPVHGAEATCDEESCEFTGLRAGTGYVVEVAARNARGLGEPAVSGEVFTIVSSIGDGEDVTADPESVTPGEDFVGTPIHATMPADRNGRINIPPGRLSRNANATDVVAVDVKLPTGLGGCLAIDEDVAAEYDEVEFTVYDDGFQAWVTGPEHHVGEALDDGAVYWDRDCAATDEGAANDDEDGSGEGPFEYGVADEGDGHTSQEGDAGHSLAEADLDPADIGLGDGDAHRDVVLDVDGGKLEVGDVELTEPTTVGGVTVAPIEGSAGLLLSGPEHEVTALLESGEITLTDNATVSAWASSPDRGEVIVTSGQAHATIAIPENGGTLAFDQEALATFEASGGTAEVVDGALHVTGPVVDPDESHTEFQDFLAAGVTWSPPDEQGTYPLTAELKGDGGFATMLTAPLTFEGPPGEATDVSAVWDDDELVVSWQPGTPAGLPAPSYAAYTGGHPGHACEPEEPDAYECRIAEAEVSPELDGSLAVAVEAANDHGDATTQQVTPAALTDVSLSADSDRVTVSWDPTDVEGDEVRISLDPGDGACVASPDAGSCTVHDLAAEQDYTVLAVVRGDGGDSNRVDVGAITPLAVEVAGQDTEPQAEAGSGPVALPIDLGLPGTWTDPVEVTVAIPEAAGSLKPVGVPASEHDGVIDDTSTPDTLVLWGDKTDVQAALDDLHWTPSGEAGSHELTITASDEDGRSTHLVRSLSVHTTLSAPTSVTAERDGEQVTVSWGEPQELGAAPVDRYVVSIAEHECVELTTPLECVLDGVAASLRDVTVTVFDTDEESASTTVRLAAPSSGSSEPSEGSTELEIPEDEHAPTSGQVETTAGTVEFRFSGARSEGEPEDGESSSPTVSVTPVNEGEETARGITMLGQRYAVETTNLAFDEVEVCFPVDGDSFAASGRAADRMRLLHAPSNDAERDITTTVDLDDDPVRVCGVTDRFSEFQVAVYAAERHWGADRYVTAAAVAAELHPDGSSTVYVASGERHPDGLVAGVAADRDDAPLLLTRATEMPETTAAALVDLDPDRVVVVGGPEAINDAVADEISVATGAEVEREAGANRFATAAAVAQRSFPDGAPIVYLATGWAYPDALTGGAAALGVGGAMLLTDGQTLSGPTRDGLEALSPDQVVVLGGPEAIDDAILEAVGDVVPSVSRVGGATRYETAGLVAESFAADSAVAATGADFADALVATPLAGRHGAPIVLVEGDTLPPAARDALAGLEPEALSVVGGHAAVGPQAELALSRLLPLFVPDRL